MPLSVSVVIPVCNAGGLLRACLADLRRSAVTDFECIVVDDGSTDDSVDVAREFGAIVRRTETHAGPARARNLGAVAAKGDVIFFIDADVCVYPDTIGRVRAAFVEDSKLDALIGSYDDAPGSQDFISQYKNLMHCFVHQTSRRRACTFWSGCGAIRRDVFLQHRGFDEFYRRPAIEDIELGYRLQMAGRKVILDRGLMVKHLKRWTFWGLLKSDILDRGIPWTELILRERSIPNDLNLRLSQRVTVALVFLLVGVATLTAFSSLPHHFLVFSFFFILIAIVVLNNQFYRFLAAKRGRLFALAAVPLHLLYHLYNGISFLIGAARYSLRTWPLKRPKLAGIRPSDERR